MLLLAGNAGVAQSIGVKTDRDQILIGERVEYDLLIDLPAPGYRLQFNLPDSLEHFEVVDNKNFDTIRNNNGAALVYKKITFTSFDSGAWYIPPFEVYVDKDSRSSKFLTTPILVNVGYSPADSTTELRDIKPVMEVAVTDYFWAYVAAMLLGLLILGYLAYKYFKNRERKQLPVFHSPLTPYQQAKQALGELASHNLDESTGTREYYTALVFLFKRYYSRKSGVNMMSYTTSDMLIATRSQLAENPALAGLAEALRIADAVKFAKFFPGQDLARKNRNDMNDIIDLIEKNSTTQKT